MTTALTQHEAEQRFWQMLRCSGVDTLREQLRLLQDTPVDSGNAVLQAGHRAVCEEIEEHLIAWQVVESIAVRVVPMEHIGLAVTTETEA